MFRITHDVLDALFVLVIYQILKKNIYDIHHATDKILLGEREGIMRGEFIAVILEIEVNINTEISNINILLILCILILNNFSFDNHCIRQKSKKSKRKKIFRASDNYAHGLGNYAQSQNRKK